MRPGVTRVLAGLIVGLSIGVSPGLSSAFAGGIPDTQAALIEGDCALCHQVPGVAAPDRTESCSGCHAWVWSVSANPAARARALEIFPLWTRYEHTVKTYAAVPALDVAAARLDPAWLRTWLADPHDLRPGMPETMVRLGLDPAEIDALATWANERLMPVPPTPLPALANLAAGEQLFATRGCAACHSFGARHPGPGIPAAPDLQYTRERMNPDRIVAWILDPRALAPGSLMPSLGLTRAEAISVRDYVLLADPESEPVTPGLPPLPQVNRPVAWAEVEEKVFGRICVHCHMDPAQNDGRPGPGNGGGFGFAATGLELQTPESVRAHGDAVVAAMLRRRGEASRDVVPAGARAAEIERPVLPGMPLGLPPIPDEDIALVVAWLASSSEPG